MSAAFYYNSVRDLLSAATELPGVLNYPDQVSYAENIGNGKSFGTKLVLQGSAPAGWRWNSGYTLTAVRAHLLVSGPPMTPYDYNNATPTSAILFGIGYSGQKFEADLQGKWQSRYTDVIFDVSPEGASYTPEAIANFVTIDARIGYNVTRHLVLAVTADQFQSAQTIESAGSEVGAASCSAPPMASKALQFGAIRLLFRMKARESHLPGLAG